MSLNISTTGLTASVILDDLGQRTYTHPYTGNILDEFDMESITSSIFLQTAIDNNYIIILDGNGGTVSNLNNLLMFSSTYDDDNDGIITNTLNLNGLDGVYYLDLINATGSLSQDIINNSGLSLGSTGATGPQGIQGNDTVQTYLRVISTDSSNYNNITPLSIPWNGSNIKSLITHSTSVTPERIMVQSDGIYDIYASIWWDDSSVTRSNLKLTVWVNGTEQVLVGAGQGGYGRSAGQGDNAMSHISTLLDLNTNDYIEIKAERNSDAGNCFMIPNLSVFKINKLSGVQGPQGIVGPTGPNGGPIGPPGPTGPSSGVTSVNFKMGTVVLNLNDINDVNTSVGSVNNGDTIKWFGTEWNQFKNIYEYMESEGTTSTTSGTYTTKTTLTTTNLPSGLYEISWYSETQQSSTSGITDIQVRYGTTEIGQTEIEGEDISDWQCQTGFKSNISLSGIQTITLRFRRLDNGTANIRRARLKIIRIS